MTDMLIKLYDLPDVDAEVEGLATAGIEIRQPLALDRRHLLRFVDEHFRSTCAGWVDECDAALLRHPVTCFIAVESASTGTDRIVGFACYDGSAKGFFGPFGVDAEFRRRGIGRTLLVRTLEAMAHAGYGYAIAGWVSSEEYYANAVGAIAIPDSYPGIYRRMIRSG
ncbi:MAG: GNAT family N-acetyltransferase [Planctomycetota bacterium]